MSSAQSSKDHHSGGHFPHRHMELLFPYHPNCDVVVAEERSSNRVLQYPRGDGCYLRMHLQGTWHLTWEEMWHVRWDLAYEMLGHWRPFWLREERLSWTEPFLCSLHVSDIALNQSLRESPQGWRGTFPRDRGYRCVAFFPPVPNPVPISTSERGTPPN